MVVGIAAVGTAAVGIAACTPNLQSVIHYPYPIRIRGIVENDIRIHPYPQKFTDIRKYLSAVPYPRFRAVRTSANKHLNRTGTGNNTPITQKYDLLACFLL